MRSQELRKEIGDARARVKHLKEVNEDIRFTFEPLGGHEALVAQAEDHLAHLLARQRSAKPISLQRAGCESYVTRCEKSRTQADQALEEAQKEYDAAIALLELRRKDSAMAAAKVEAAKKELAEIMRREADNTSGHMETDSESDEEDGRAPPGQQAAVSELALAIMELPSAHTRGELLPVLERLVAQAALFLPPPALSSRCVPGARGARPPGCAFIDWGAAAAPPQAAVAEQVPGADGGNDAPAGVGG